jgi:hypothetical protein
MKGGGKKGREGEGKKKMKGTEEYVNRKGMGKKTEKKGEAERKMEWEG